MLIKILCNKLLLGRATSQLASCTEPSRAGSLFSRATKTGSARARSERRAGPSRAELLRARASSSSSSFFSNPTFAGNFQGTYVRPGNSWDLRSCRQQLGESLREYIRRFLKQRTELPNITNSDVIGAFLDGTTCRDLVSKLGHKTPTKASELMDIATKFASGQKAVEAIFWKDKQPQGRQQEDVPEASAQRGTKKKAKKKSQAKRDTADADLVAAVEHRNPRKPPGGANLFYKMLKESCLYHQGPVKHSLEECVMLRRYFHKTGPPAEGGKGHDNDKKEGDKAEEFPEVHDCFMIYGGQVVNASARHRKQERREVCSVKVAAPVYLN
jgi:hypothetical protein